MRATRGKRKLWNAAPQIPSSSFPWLLAGWVQEPPVSLSEGRWGKIHGELGSLPHMSKQASAAAVPFCNTEQRAITMAFQLCSQLSAPHLFPPPHSPFSLFFYYPVIFLFLSQPHKCTHDISMPEPSHRQMGIFSSTQTLLLFLPKWLEGLLTKEVCQAHSQQALPKKLYASPSLVSPKKPSPPWAVLPLNCSSWTVTSGGSMMSQDL